MFYKCHTLYCHNWSLRIHGSSAFQLWQLETVATALDKQCVNCLTTECTRGFINAQTFTRYRITRYFGLTMSLSTYTFIMTVEYSRNRKRTMFESSRDSRSVEVQFTWDNILSAHALRIIRKVIQIFNTVKIYLKIPGCWLMNNRWIFQEPF